MHPGIGLVPIDHARVHGNLHLFPCLAELQGELLTAPDDEEAMAGIAMPRHHLAGFEDQPTDHETVAPRGLPNVPYQLRCEVPSAACRS